MTKRGGVSHLCFELSSLRRRFGFLCRHRRLRHRFGGELLPETIDPLGAPRNFRGNLRVFTVTERCKKRRQVWTPVSPPRALRPVPWRRCASPPRRPPALPPRDGPAARLLPPRRGLPQRPRPAARRLARPAWLSRAPTARAARARGALDPLGAPTSRTCLVYTGVRQQEWPLWVWPAGGGGTANTVSLVHARVEWSAPNSPREGMLVKVPPALRALRGRAPTPTRRQGAKVGRRRR